MQSFDIEEPASKEPIYHVTEYNMFSNENQEAPRGGTMAIYKQYTREGEDGHTSAVELSEGENNYVKFFGGPEFRGMDARVRASLGAADSKWVSIAPGDPLNFDIEESDRKYFAMSKIYGPNDVFYFQVNENTNEYRIVMRFIEGESFHAIMTNAYLRPGTRFLKCRIKYALALLDAVELFQNNNLVSGDLRPENFIVQLRDKNGALVEFKDVPHDLEDITIKIFPIDGGCSTVVSTPFPKRYICSSVEDKMECQKKCWHIAPEAWGVQQKDIPIKDQQAPIAEFSSDMFSYFKLLSKYFLPTGREFDDLFQAIIQTGCDLDPFMRPTLVEARNALQCIDNLLLNPENEDNAIDTIDLNEEILAFQNGSSCSVTPNTMSFISASTASLEYSDDSEDVFPEYNRRTSDLASQGMFASSSGSLYSPEDIERLSADSSIDFTLSS